MRLLMTTDTVGGVWTYTTELITELLQRDIAIALVTIGRAPSAVQTRWLQRTRLQWGGAFRWEMSVARLEWMSDNERAFLDVVPQLVRVAEEFRAEVLHSNQFCFGALPLRIPKLVVAHSDVFSWAAACRHGQMTADPWLNKYSILTTAGLDGAHTVVAPTRWMLDELAKHFSISCRTQVIANGRNLAASTLPSSSRLQAVTAGRIWDEAKNLQLLSSVHAPFPILVAGETNFEFQGSPLAPAGTTMLGALEEDDLLALFRDSAIYLCTSRYEPFGLAPLEAALCGCAVVANDIPSLREVWGDGALYFHDASSLSALLTMLGSDPQQLVAAQHRSWLRGQRYTRTRMADQYLALYRSMLSRREAATDVA